MTEGTVSNAFAVREGTLITPPVSEGVLAGIARQTIIDIAEAAGIPCMAFKFSENTGQFQPIREQTGTFADSMKLWSAV